MPPGQSAECEQQKRVSGHANADAEQTVGPRTVDQSALHAEHCLDGRANEIHGGRTGDGEHSADESGLAPPSAGVTGRRGNFGGPAAPEAGETALRRRGTGIGIGIGIGTGTGTGREGAARGRRG
jgi:hypothetical protein